MYRIVFSNDAKKDLKELSKKAPQAVKKLSKLLEEIQEHPRTGTGQVMSVKCKSLTLNQIQTMRAAKGEHALSVKTGKSNTYISRHQEPTS